MERELLGYNVMVRIKNDFEEGFPNEHTRFGYLCSKDRLLSNSKDVVEIILKRFEDYSRERDSFVSGYPLARLNTPELDTSIKYLRKLLESVITPETISNVYDKFVNAKNEEDKVKPVFVLKDKKLTIDLFNYLMEVEVDVIYTPVFDRVTGTNFIPVCWGM